DRRADRAVRGDLPRRQARGRRDRGLALTELEKNGRLQRERPRRPPRIHADRVATLVVAGVRAGVEGGGRVDTTAALPRTSRRGALGLEERIHRLDVQALEWREPEAEDDRPVLTTLEAILTTGQRLFHLNVGGVQRRGRSDVQRERDAREVTVGIQRQLV